MRDLIPILPALVLPIVGATSRPDSLAADVHGLVSDIERRFALLESYCGEVGDVPPHDAEFDRLDGLVSEAIDALVGTPSRDADDLVEKASALLRAPIKEDGDRCDRVGASLARDVNRRRNLALAQTWC